MPEPTISAPNRIINLDSEYKIKIEKGNDFSNSIFVDVYKQARQNVTDILSHSKDDNKHDSYNNIIAFTGERGKGKSSTMISFLESLVNKEDKENHKEFYTKEDESDIDFSKFNFLTIDVIDPSLFRREEQLFEIIIAKLFSQFRKEVEDKNGKHVNDEDRRELVKLFQQVFENLKYINNRADIYKQDALDALIKLSTSSNLKENFDKLIDKYLAVFGNKDITNFLVIAIDDFDLKIDGVYEMIEDIRQYFVTKNIIILMSFKMQQMKEALFNSLTTIKYKGRNTISQAVSNERNDLDVVNKLIEKIFPTNKLLSLTDFNNHVWSLKSFTEDSIDYIKSHCTIYSKHSEGNKKEFVDSDVIITLIKRKLFINFDLYLSEEIKYPIFEDLTLRSLYQLLRSIDNKLDFKNYLYNFYNSIDSFNTLDFIFECKIKLINYEYFNYLTQKFDFIKNLGAIVNYNNEEYYQDSLINTSFKLILSKISTKDSVYKEFTISLLLYKFRKIYDLTKKNSPIKDDLAPKVMSGFNESLKRIKNFSKGGLLNYNLLPNTQRIIRFTPIDSVNSLFDLKKFLENNSHLEIDSETNFEQLIILSSIIEALGRAKNEPYNFIINEPTLGNRGGQVTHLTINLFNSLIAPININNNITRLSVSLSKVEQRKLMEIESQWYQSKYLRLFQDPEFIQLFHDEIVETHKLNTQNKIYADYPQDDIASIFFIIITNCLSSVFRKFQIEQPYIDISYHDFRNANYIFDKIISLGEVNFEERTELNVAQFTESHLGQFINSFFANRSIEDNLSDKMLETSKNVISNHISTSIEKEKELVIQKIKTFSKSGTPKRLIEEGIRKLDQPYRDILLQEFILIRHNKGNKDIENALIKIIKAHGQPTQNN